ncbi:uncharacterized protein EI90DRAFT_2830572, partial [Cantharellus anzutake]|uniref:uncharacterized protein n=1 Tax=Cantharellus anzutake TaxID=1750568 RepID=UPI001906FE4C
MLTRFSRVCRHHGHVSAGYRHVGKHCKHPGGHDLANEKSHSSFHNLSTIQVSGVHSFHLKRNPYWSPIINVDKLWSLVPEEEKAGLTSESEVVPVIDILAHRCGKVLG